MLKNFAAVVAASAMLFTSATAAFAGSDSDQSALAPGKAAGVKQAQMSSGTTLLLVVGTAAVLGGALLVGSGSGSGSSAGSTTNPVSP